ncbi:replication-relaxation family protein [Lysinibacillus antri]|uniref:Replication-relaxation n=1 Tax=Lysinibacillus antri TaxID=2498145 RepID=A0A3S0R5N8_9BACI|nr:replication-relaxation family protein [Lysinibacillus antri]RUL51117.1 hypothetical protein EK386_12980 [Lysinibacillus antri]
MKKKILTKRDEQILLLLKRFDFLSREQLNRYFHLGTVRNTNRVLSGLSEYLSSFRDGYMTVYYLNSQGRDYVDCDKIRKKGGHIAHILMRNDAWLFYKCPRDWKNEVKISNGAISVIADAVFTRNGFYHFLEVDHLQTMKENRAKINRYKSLMESLVKQFGYYPTIVWITTTEHRKKQIEGACDGLKTIVYTINDIR